MSPTIDRFAISISTISIAITTNLLPTFKIEGNTKC
jgi:hypothetical protein